MKRQKNWLVSLILVLVTGSVAWAQPNFTIGSVSGNQNDVVAVEIRVDNFENLIGFQIPIRWDAAALNYVSNENLNSELSNVAFATPPALPEGQLNMSWFNSSNPVTIANGSLFITINFRLVGAPGTSSEVTFLNDPGRLEAVNADNPTVNIGINFTAGTIQNLNSGGADLRLILDDQTVDMGDNFCMRMRVQNFTDVRALEYNLTWDPAVIQFSELRNFNLTGLDEADFNITNVGTGQLRMAWISNSTGGETLPDNTSIFEICFEAIGSGGTSTGIAFSDIISEPMATGTDGSVAIQGGVDGFGLIAGDGSGPIDGEQCLDITVNDFNNINTFQFSLNWDANELAYAQLSNINPGIAGSIDTSSAIAGQFPILWFSTQPVSIANGEILFTICFTGVNQDCDVASTVEFSNTPTPLIVSTVDGVIPNDQISLVNGSITPTCGPMIVCDAETIDMVSCNGDLGSIFVTVLPADGNYTYTWNNQASQSEDLENVRAGSYELVVTETSTNLTATKTVVISEPDAIVIDGMSTDVTGTNDDGTITINSVTGGTGTLDCLWSPDITQDCLGASDLPANTYTLTVVDENDCSATAEFIINSAEFNFTLNTGNALCADENGDCGGLIEVSITGGAGPYTYTINGASFDGRDDNLCAGDYIIEVTDTGLNETKSETVTLTGPDPISFDLAITQPSQITSMDGSVIVSNLAGGTSPYDISWPGTNSDTLSDVGSGLYQLTVTDDNGCRIQEMVELTGDPNRCFKGNPVMTPNGDGKNDQLVITCVNSFDNALNVYNRWGQRVHTQDNYDDTWSGVDLKGNDLEDGVYYWVLIVTLQDSSTREVKGYINLLRNLK